MFGAQTLGLRSRFLDEIPAELLDEGSRATACGAGRLGGAITAGVGRGARSLVTRRLGRRRAARRRRVGERGGSQTAVASAFALGEDVVHAAFGEGVVTGVEPGGVIVVRFAGDGSERKLMAEYAPVSRR